MKHFFWLSLITLFLSACSTASISHQNTPAAAETTPTIQPASNKPINPKKFAPVSVTLPSITPTALANQFASQLQQTRIVVIGHTNSVKLILPAYYIFLNDKTINPRFVPYLTAILTELKSINYQHIDINAYTDNHINLKANFKLSAIWANLMMNYFISQGVNKTKISAKGYGEYHPLATNFTFAGRLQNRRVEVVIEV